MSFDDDMAWARGIIAERDATIAELRERLTYLRTELVICKRALERAEKAETELAAARVNAEAVREACAKVCDAYRGDGGEGDKATIGCAKAIRALDLKVG